MRKAEECQKLMQAWCPFFPNGCPPTYELGQTGGCALNGENKFTCTLDRACQPRPVANGIVMRRSNKRREILLVMRKGTKVQPGKWAVPGGGIHCGETVEQAIVREVKEETGYGVELTDGIAAYEDGMRRLLNAKVIPFQVVSNQGVDDCRNYVGFFGYCRPIAEPERAADDPFTESCDWFNVDQLKEMADGGHLTPLDTTVLKQCVFHDM